MPFVEPLTLHPQLRLGPSTCRLHLSSDQIALLSAGAYGSVMASNYNSRGIAAEVLVSGRKAALVRTRQPVADIWANEKIATWQK